MDVRGQAATFEPSGLFVSGHQKAASAGGGGVSGSQVSMHSKSSCVTNTHWFDNCIRYTSYQTIHWNTSYVLEYEAVAASSKDRVITNLAAGPTNLGDDRRYSSDTRFPSGTCPHTWVIGTCFAEHSQFAECPIPPPFSS